MKIINNSLAFILIGFLVTTTTVAQEQDNKTMLVLDASGSMWGQIDGKTKIEIAKNVVHRTVNSWDSEQSLGLIAYGHNRKGDCSDIDVLIEPSKVDSAQFSSVTNSLSPKGKTPLSAAVKLAAEKLQYTEQAATVILISDGKETCDLDPCAMGKSLEQAGIDFTAHIIGFDVPKADTIGLRCLAEETGGSYLEANDADELEKALQQTRDVVTDRSELERTPAFVNVPVEVFAGSEFDVTWNGPENVSDYLIARTAKGDSQTGAVYIGSETIVSPTKMKAPEMAGTYLVHYELKDKTSLAKAELTVITPDASVDAPDAVMAGAEFDVLWAGPENEFDSIRIFDMQDMPVHEFAMLSNDDFTSPVRLAAPIELGSYQVVYRTLGRQTLAKDVFEVTEALATVRIPEGEVNAGAPFDVQWAGPSNKSDRLYIYQESGERLNLYKFVDKEDIPATVEMTAPEEAGEYTVAYTVSSKKVLAQANLRVVPVTAMVTGPSVVNADSEFEVKWFGPNHNRDSIYTFSDEGKDVRRYKILGKDDSSSPLLLKAPKEPGTYELRYLTPKKKVLATHSFTVQ